MTIHNLKIHCPMATETHITWMNTACNHNFFCYVFMLQHVLNECCISVRSVFYIVYKLFYGAIFKKNQ